MYKCYYLGWGLLTSNINMSWRTSVNLVAGHAVDCVCVCGVKTPSGSYQPTWPYLEELRGARSSNSLWTPSAVNVCGSSLALQRNTITGSYLYQPPTHLSGELLGLTLTNNKNMWPNKQGPLFFCFTLHSLTPTFTPPSIIMQIKRTIASIRFSVIMESAHQMGDEWPAEAH